MRGQWLRNVPAMRQSDKVLATKRCVWGNPQLLKGGYPGLASLRLMGAEAKCSWVEMAQAGER